MGFYLELRASPGHGDLSEKELKEKLLGAKFVVHPEYGEPTYYFKYGTLTLHAPPQIKEGNWGEMRLSSAVSLPELREAVNAVSALGGRLYHHSTDTFLSTNNLSQVSRTHRHSAEMLGVVEPSGRHKGKRR